MQTIALVIPYFGKWPKWISLFFDSCVSNYDVDFYFFTDCGRPSIEAGNLHFFEMSFRDYCSMVSGRLGIDFSPSKPIKLCDLRPFYSFIHQDILSRYDFWGFADVDLVFGNIRKFYTDALLERYDVLSTHFDRLSGHLAIIRNNERYRNLCFRMRHWKRKLLLDRNCVLDESEFSYQIYPEIRMPRICYAKIWKFFGWNVANPLHTWFIRHLNTMVDIDGRRIRYVQMNVHPIWTGSRNWAYYPGRVYEREKSRLMDIEQDEECIYCHFLPYKNNVQWKQKDFSFSLHSNRIMITPEGIY